MLKELREYVLENNFKITIIKDQIDILNYKEIDHFDDNKIIIRYNEGTLVIKGEELIIAKLLDDEILINGKVKMVELKWLKN